jgi:hypothetical protein
MEVQRCLDQPVAEETQLPTTGTEDHASMPKLSKTAAGAVDRVTLVEQIARVRQR